MTFNLTQLLFLADRDIMYGVKLLDILGDYLLMYSLSTRVANYLDTTALVCRVLLYGTIKTEVTMRLGHT